MSDSVDAADFKAQLESVIATYRKTIENVHVSEEKLQEVRKAEAVALTDDGGDEKKIVKAVSEAQGLRTGRRTDCSAPGGVPDQARCGGISPPVFLVLKELSGRLRKRLRQIS